MQHRSHIRREELTKPDLFSRILLIVIVAATVIGAIITAATVQALLKELRSIP